MIDPAQATLIPLRAKYLFPSRRHLSGRKNCDNVEGGTWVFTIGGGFPAKARTSPPTGKKGLTLRPPRRSYGPW